MLDEVKEPTHVPQVKRGASGRPLAGIVGPPPLSERVIRWVGIVGYSISGAAAVLTPFLLWMTWSPEIYFLVLLVGFLACCGIVLLSRFLPEYRDEEARRRRRD